MRAALSTAVDRVGRREEPTPEPGDGEVAFTPRDSGIYRSQLHGRANTSAALAGAVTVWGRLELGWGNGLPARDADRLVMLPAHPGVEITKAVIRPEWG